MFPDLFLCFCAIIWGCAFYIATKKLPNYSFNWNSKVIRNCVSIMHASGVILTYNIVLYATSDISHIYYWSASYYLYDLFLEIWTLIEVIRTKQNKKILESVGMIVHHLIGIGTMDNLYNHEIQELLFWGFYWAEFSNLPLYAVHHFMSIPASKEDKENKLKLLLPLEISFFAVFRGVLLLFFLYEGFFVLPWELYICSIMIYALSIFWLVKLSKQYWAIMHKKQINTDEKIVKKTE